MPETTKDSASSPAVSQVTGSKSNLAPSSAVCDLFHRKCVSSQPGGFSYQERLTVSAVKTRVIAVQKSFRGPRLWHAH